MVRPDGQYLALFIAVLLFIWLAEERKNQLFIRCSLAILILLLFPPAAELLIRYQTGFYGRENIWILLPMTAMLAYGLVLAETKMMTALMRNEGSKISFSTIKNRIMETFILVILTALLFLGGTLSVAKTEAMKRQELGGLPQDAKILAYLNIPKDDFVYLLAPDEISSFARIYSGNLLLPYGRDLYEEGLNAFLYDTYDEEMQLLHDWINGSLVIPKDSESAKKQQAYFLYYCAEAGYHYLIFSYERYDEALAEALAEQDAYRESYTPRLPYLIYELQ